MENKIVVALKGIVLYEGKVLLLQRADNDDIGGGTWEFAGGKLEFGETLKAALEREIFEETGIAAKVESILYATTFMTHQWRQVIILTYLCTTQNNKVLLSSEHKDYKWASSGEAKEYLPQSILEDLEKNAVFEAMGYNNS